MSTAVREADRAPVPVLTAVGLLAFLAVSALAGGVALTFGGPGMRPPREWLAAIPLVESWVTPGLVLGLGFGAGSVVVAHGLLWRPDGGLLAAVSRRSGRHWSWLGTLALGVGHVLWIALELRYLPEPSILQAVYGGVGLALVALPLTPSARHHLAMGRPPAPGASP